MNTRNIELRDTVSDLKEFIVWPKRLIVYKINKLVLTRQMQNQVFYLNQPIKYRMGSDVAPSMVIGVKKTLEFIFLHVPLFQSQMLL